MTAPSVPDPRRISRRTVLKASAATAGTIAAAAAWARYGATADAASFVYGADVSWAPQMEAAGYTWKNSAGQTQDLLTILKGYGISAIRLRTFVNPSSSPTDGHCSINEVAAFAKRVKAAGMSILLDYMFGDTWNSVGVQNPPAAWKSLSYSQMLSTMNSYVNQTMNVMKSNDVLPTWVQIGNEINSGICHPVGSVSNPAQMTGLLNAAYNQVKAVSPSSVVCIHLAQPQKFDSMTTFFNGYAGNGGKWDMSVFSSYGSASVASGIVANMQTISAQYGKPFMQTEFGGPVSNVGSTESSFVAYINALKSTGGQGIFYWEPECMSPFTSYAMGAWDSSTRQPTAIMNGYPGGGGGGGTTYVRLRNARTGLVIDGMGATSNGANAGQSADSGSTNQQWVVESDGSFVRIRNRATGLYLDGMGATANGAAAGQWSDTNSNNQQWTQVAAGGNVRFKNRATGLYLDGLGATSSGSTLGQWADSGSTNQQWTTVAAS
jgi:arabinogalactan endo-1,4-beta-galactosidase